MTSDKPSITWRGIPFQYDSVPPRFFFVNPEVAQRVQDYAALHGDPRDGIEMLAAMFHGKDAESPRRAGGSAANQET